MSKDTAARLLNVNSAVPVRVFWPLLSPLLLAATPCMNGPPWFRFSPTWSFTKAPILMQVSVPGTYQKPAPYKLQTLTYSTALAFTGRSAAWAPATANTPAAEPNNTRFTEFIIPSQPPGFRQRDRQSPPWRLPLCCIDDPPRRTKPL